MFSHGFITCLCALLLWIIVTDLHHLLPVQVIVVMMASFISIVLLRTPSRVEAPVRVTGDARQFTLPAYEYPASDTESIADSDDSGVGEGRARMIPGSMDRWRRILDAFYESRPILITFALATSTSMNLAQEPIVNAEARFVLCVVGATVGLFVTYLPGTSRTNFLLVVLAVRAVFLMIGIAEYNAPEVSILLYCSGGFVESVFWTVIPVMIYELRGRKRLTLLWSCAVLCCAVVTALQSGLVLLFFNTESSFAICKEDKCPLLLMELRFALIMCAIIAIFWLKQYHPADRNSSNS
uniref:Uncharacterized protein n=1 Tax=Parascaris univalens TaxID=6257 RepID=A0A915BCF5_PARUN